jgi:hypothetical protein
MRRRSQQSSIKYMFAGGAMVAALGLTVHPQSLMPKASAKPDGCQRVTQPDAVLSRSQLTQLLSIPERSTKAQIRQALPAPYCQLSDVQVRSTMTAQREAYPLAFDPQTWLVVLYEGDEYVGYDFSFRHD